MYSAGARAQVADHPVVYLHDQVLIPIPSFTLSFASIHTVNSPR